MSIVDQTFAKQLVHTLVQRIGPETVDVKEMEELGGGSIIYTPG